MIELEKTYLVKTLPRGIKDCPFNEIIDIYFPASAEHPKIRLRKNGDKINLTKKQPIDESDASRQEEMKIMLNSEEYLAFKQLPGKQVRKLRYCYEYQGLIAEIDIFQDQLKGLVLADVEFTKDNDKQAFTMPDFCLSDVTQELFIAGGMLGGKSYQEIEQQLSKFSYQKLFID